MNINQLTPVPAVMTEMGRRLAHIRKQQGMSQDKLAKEAGIGVATLRRIEAGEGSQMESWIKILRALGMISSIEALLPEKFDSPLIKVLDEVGRSNRRRTGGIRWGDENP